MEQQELDKAIYKASILKGEFILRSGVKSNYYFDKYQFEGHPHLLLPLSHQMTKLIPKTIELLAGLEMGAIPLATALSLKTGLPTVFVRKVAKEHGTMKDIEGPNIEGKNLLPIEDVITSAGEVVKSYPRLIKMGANIRYVLCAVEREGPGRDNLEKLGLELIAYMPKERVRQLALEYEQDQAKIAEEIHKNRKTFTL